MSGPGEYLYGLWNSATEKAKQVTASIASGANSMATTIGQAELQRAEMDRQAAQALGTGIKNTASAVGRTLKAGAEAAGQAEMQRIEAEQAANEAAVNMIKAAPSAIAGVAKAAYNKLDQTFGEGQNAIICLPRWFGRRTFMKYH